MENKEGRRHLGYPSPRCPSAVLPLSLAPAASGHLGAMRDAGTYCGRQARRVPPAALSARGALRALGGRGGGGSSCGALFCPLGAARYLSKARRASRTT